MQQVLAVSSFQALFLPRSEPHLSWSRAAQNRVVPFFLKVYFIALNNGFAELGGRARLVSVSIAVTLCLAACTDLAFGNRCPLSAIFGMVNKQQ